MTRIRKLRLGQDRDSTEIPVLLTSAIHVQLPGIALKDKTERIKQTYDAVEKLYNTGYRNIVLVDGSGYKFESEPEIRNYVAELHTLQVDIHQLCLYGAGWGEGEIIRYALANSTLLKNANDFIKITARLKITNLRTFLRFRNRLATFDLRGRGPNICVDTRVYCINKNFYCKHLLETHQSVRDSEGVFLEHAVFDALQRLKVPYVSIIPIIVDGASGHTGKKYSPPKRVRYLLGLMRNVIASANAHLQ